MKYAFLVTIAAFAFLISCGKKDKKQGQQGKTEGAQIDCKIEKNKKEKACLTPEELAKAAQQPADVDTGGDRDSTGSPAPKTEYSTIPNTEDSDLKGNSVMPLSLNNQTALLAEIKINSENDELTNTKVYCGEIENAEKLHKDAAVADPDELKNTMANIYLFGKSSIVVDLKVTKGDTTVTAKGKTKYYMLTCNSDSSVAASKAKYTNEESRELKVGQQVFEYVTLGGKNEVGQLVSFDCNSDETLLDGKVKTIAGKEKKNKALSRIRLRKGSSVMVHRAVDYKEGDKKLSEMGSEAQKTAKISIISCG